MWYNNIFVILSHMIKKIEKKIHFYMWYNNIFVILSHMIKKIEKNETQLCMEIYNRKHIFIIREKNLVYSNNILAVLGFKT